MRKWRSSIVLSLLVMNACSSASQLDKETPLVDYCDLVANPSHFDEQVVRVNASYIVGFEWSYLIDEKCSSDPLDTAQTWIIPEDTWCEGAAKTYIYPPPDHSRAESLKREIILLGKFHNFPGGHLGGYPYQMEFICLEAAGQWSVIR
jgi:hypothetical protein